MIMNEYKEYNTQSLPGRIKNDLDKIVSIFNYYDKKILYREDKYFIEFILEEFKFKKDNLILIDKIKNRCITNIRLSYDKNYNLIIVIPKFLEIFLNN